MLLNYKFISVGSIPGMDLYNRGLSIWFNLAMFHEDWFIDYYKLVSVDIFYEKGKFWYNFQLIDFLLFQIGLTVFLLFIIWIFNTNFVKIFLFGSDFWKYLLRWTFLDSGDQHIPTVEPLYQLEGKHLINVRTGELNNLLSILYSQSKRNSTIYYDSSWQRLFNVKNRETFFGYKGFSDLYPKNLTFRQLSVLNNNYFLYIPTYVSVWLWWITNRFIPYFSLLSNNFLKKDISKKFLRGLSFIKEYNFLKKDVFTFSRLSSSKFQFTEKPNEDTQMSNFISDIITSKKDDADSTTWVFVYDDRTSWLKKLVDATQKFVLADWKLVKDDFLTWLERETGLSLGVFGVGDKLNSRFNFEYADSEVGKIGINSASIKTDNKNSYSEELDYDEDKGADEDDDVQDSDVDYAEQTLQAVYKLHEELSNPGFIGEDNNDLAWRYNLNETFYQFEWYPWLHVIDELSRFTYTTPLLDRNNFLKFFRKLVRVTGVSETSFLGVNHNLFDRGQIRNPYSLPFLDFSKNIYYDKLPGKFDIGLDETLESYVTEISNKGKIRDFNLRLSGYEDGDLDDEDYRFDFEPQSEMITSVEADKATVNAEREYDADIVFVAEDDDEDPDSDLLEDAEIYSNRFGSVHGIYSVESRISSLKHMLIHLEALDVIFVKTRMYLNEFIPEEEEEEYFEEVEEDDFEYNLDVVNLKRNYRDYKKELKKRKDAKRNTNYFSEDYNLDVEPLKNPLEAFNERIREEEESDSLAYEFFDEFSDQLFAHRDDDFWADARDYVEESGFEYGTSLYDEQDLETTYNYYDEVATMCYAHSRFFMRKFISTFLPSRTIKVYIYPTQMDWRMFVSRFFGGRAFSYIYDDIYSFFMVSAFSLVENLGSILMALFFVFFYFFLFSIIYLLWFKSVFFLYSFILFLVVVTFICITTNLFFFFIDCFFYYLSISYFFFFIKFSCSFCCFIILYN